MLVVSHPTGNANVRAVLRAAERSSLLDGFWTTLAFPHALANTPVVGTDIRRELGRRSFPEVPWRRTNFRPAREAIRIIAGRLNWTRLVKHETGWASVDRVYHQLDHAVASYVASKYALNIRAVYAYEDGALATFREAQKMGLTRLYDLPIAHWRTLRRLLQEEAELHPAWATTMEGLVDSTAKLARKDEEIELADKVIVASSFTRRSLEEHFGQALDITVTPYGAPPPQVTRPIRRKPEEPIHLIYAGHLAQRKGIAYLIEALRRLDVDWRLTLAGPKPASAPMDLDNFLGDTRCTWLGHIPHATLLEKMRCAHLFVFPSIVEGFGMVLFEAMAAGLPIITTPNTAGPDIITDGQEGYIVPIRSSDAIAEHIAALSNDEDRRYEMAQAALFRATAASWRGYEDSISALFESVVR